MKTNQVVHVDVPFPESAMQQVADTTAYPYLFVCRLQIKFTTVSGHGTGTLISDRHILTAAHNILNSDYGRAVSISVAPGQNGNQKPYGEYVPKQIFMTEEYKTTPAPYDTGGGIIDYTRYLYDYAVIELSTPFVRPSDLVPVVATSQQLALGLSSIKGYPGSKPLGTMWEAYHALQAVPANDPLLFYRISTEAGESGSAVLKTIDNKLGIVGVHVAGSADMGTNFGVRITSEVRDNIRRWMNT